MFTDTGILIFITACTVKSAKTVCVLRKVGRNPVKDNADALFMTSVHKIHKVFRLTVTGCCGKVACNLISPAAVKRIFCKILKMVAVNAALAQTIHTCAAESYHAPIFQIFSSMALRDSMENGESYYIVEIRSLKRILDAAGERRTPVLCFVDEVLRGTNTVERIAAATQILIRLAESGTLGFAATHDIEMMISELNKLDAVHYLEEIK